ncbi:bifunctional metallophosphatase/5'-nucleotidase [Erysipelothrix sp. HDW6A]|uniref:bifunctional metallophosphatase/5'-nucleotidase n=1 Tax=Erysipelothrix sp. HDW6A TaxID=2714928 RepID=UPI00140CCF33|nr:5'-nucleotidase C-terminal domain-containing protein [Erysipelothrix sp. HDW6A]QIK56786.1 bifunctional metallophosphatase/5'-nucleotidase [Erysipelothrix sp. HDW6A]
MNITIYHTNDIHSNFVNMKHIHGYIKQNKTPNDFYFDSGDFTDLSSAVVQADGGISAMKIFEDCQLDAMSLGNNEIDLGLERLQTLSLSPIPLLSSNITTNDNEKISGIFPSVILEKACKRFLIIGASPYYSETLKHDAYNLFFNMGNIKSHDPIPYLKQEIEANKGNYDFCIFLSHSGINIDKELLKNIPEIDLCLGGHSHSVESKGKYSQSGRGEKIGKIVLDVNDDRISIIENVQIDLTYQENKEFDILFDKITVHTDRILSLPLPAIRELSFAPYTESEFINFICDALLHEYPCDFAIMHAGIASSNLELPVSKKSLLQTLPSKLNPTLYEISGQAIREAIHQSFDEKHIHQDGKGAGFRGTTLGVLGFSHNFSIDITNQLILINGIELVDTETYTIITDDYLQRGSGYPSMKVSEEEATFYSPFIRDIVEKHLLNHNIYKSCTINRII